MRVSLGSVFLFVQTLVLIFDIFCFFNRAGMFSFDHSAPVIQELNADKRAD